MSPRDAQEERRRLELGRDLIVNWTALLRAVHFYEQANNDSVVSHCERIRQTVQALIEQDDAAELTVRQGAIFVNGQRVRAAAVATASYQRIVDLFGVVGVGTLHVDAEASPAELEIFARLLQTMSEGQQEPSQLVKELAARGVSHLEVEVEQSVEELPDDLTEEQVARRVFMRSIGVVKSIFHEYRTSDRISARRVKRVVQSMIDSLDSGNESLMQLTSLKNYDEYTFGHSVNVSVLGIALGRHAGLSRHQLYAIGQAGMMHDLGKIGIPKEVLNKPGRLTPEERQRIALHAIDGFVAIARKLGAAAETIDIALTAFEHHLNEDGTGYPDVAKPRRKGLLSRIVTIVDRYDAMTTDRVYRTAMPPAKALAIMTDKQAPHFDQGLMSYFLNMMGHYPLGTTVRLSDQSIGLVLKGSSDPDFRHFPAVRILLDPSGTLREAT